MTPPASLEAAFAVLQARRITLLAANLFLPPATVSGASLAAALVVEAEEARLPGLPDELNPIILDPARVAAFLAGLPGQPEAVLHRLEDCFLVLGAEGLGLSLASPRDAASIADGYELVLPGDDGRVVQATLRAALPRRHAEAVATRAEAAARRYDEEVRALERAAVGTAELSPARWRRFAAATTWRLATRALADVDPRARARWRAACEAVGRWVTPPWVGMPRR